MIDLVIKMATKWLMGVDTLNKGMIHIPGGMEQNGMRFHYAIQNIMKFKTYELFITIILYLIFLDLG